MDWKKNLLTSPEVWTGGGLVVAGIAALGMGAHSLPAQALAPFGIGLILSKILTGAAKAARDRAKVRVKVRVRRDGK